MQIANIILQTLIGIYDKLDQLERNPIAVYIITSFLIFSFIIITGVTLLFTYFSNEMTTNYKIVNEKFENEIREISAPLQQEIYYPNNVNDCRRHITSMSQSTTGEFEYFNPKEDNTFYAVCFNNFEL